MEENNKEMFIPNEILVRENKTPMQQEAISLMQLIEEKEVLEEEIERRRNVILNAMKLNNIKTIKFGTGQSITHVSTSSVKVNKKKAHIFLDSLDVEKESFMKLDDSKIKKMFYDPDSNMDYDIFEIDEPKDSLRINKK